MTVARKTVPKSCLGCGRCCVPEHPTSTYATMSERDVRRLTPRERLELVSCVTPSGWTFNPNGFAMSTITRLGVSCRCKALRGRVGRDARCSIYERRPSVCRSFRRGGLECRDVLGLTDNEKVG